MNILGISEFYVSADYNNCRLPYLFFTYPVVSFGVRQFDITPGLGLSGISAPLPGSRLRDLDDDVELAVEVEMSWALTRD